jgi:hypothetical protein
MRLARRVCPPPALGFRQPPLRVNLSFEPRHERGAPGSCRLGRITLGMEAVCGHARPKAPLVRRKCRSLPAMLVDHARFIVHAASIRDRGCHKGCHPGDQTKRIF